MRGIEHILFFFLFAGELYAYIRTRSLLFFIRGRKFYAWDRTRSLLFFIRGRKFYACMTLLTFFFGKKRFENSNYGSTETRVHPPLRTLIIYIIYIYSKNVIMSYQRTPLGDNYTHPFPFTFFYLKLKSFLRNKFIEKIFYSSSNTVCFPYQSPKPKPSLSAPHHRCKDERG